MNDSEDRSEVWDLTAEEPEGDSGYAEREGRRFAAIVHWRRRLLSLSGRRAVLEVVDRPEATATLTSRRGDVLFRVPTGEIRCRRSWPACFTVECQGRSWRLWGLGVNSVRGGKRLLEITARERVLTIVPRPPGMSDKQYKRLMTTKLGQQRLWRELWLIVLRAFGAHQLDQR
ncbi:MAG TPA: hypothetical protein VME22_17085 [Solirubrobacteraceae bacterium]|nr:hypothetical protein [Solirubrobacteraceae bacterium]